MRPQQTRFPLAAVTVQISTPEINAISPPSGETESSMKYG
jgi:hypothetical protein